jgi:hypothetical protein
LHSGGPAGGQWNEAWRQFQAIRIRAHVPVPSEWSVRALLLPRLSRGPRG